MKFAIVLTTIILSVQCDPVGRSGWGSPTTTTPPPETTGWTTMPPGWTAIDHDKVGWGSAPPPPNVDVELASHLSIVGSGWGAESNAAQVHVVGDSSVPADVAIDAGGEVHLEQNGETIQGSNIGPSEVVAIHQVGVSQSADASEGANVNASGLDIIVGQGGWAGVTGQGASNADAITSLVVHP